MLSRAALVARSSASIRYRPLVTATARSLAQDKADFHCRQYHVANSTTRHQTSQFLAENVLKNKLTLCSSFTRNLSTTPIVLSTATTGVLPPILPAIPEAPVFIEPVAEVLAAGAEPTFLSLGLGGWWPSGILQQCMEFLHINCDLPWWLTIVIGTICVRALTLPVFIMSQRNAANMKNTMPEMQKLQAKLSEARSMGNALESTRHMQNMNTFMKENNLNPLKSFAVPLVQAPIFLSFFVAIRKMVNAPVESLETGGLFWFENLTLTDPYCLLPIITSATLAATLELGIESGQVNPALTQNMRYIMRAIPAVGFIFMINFPAATLCYWTTSNFISLMFAGLLKFNAVRDFVKIPRLIVHPAPLIPVKKKKFIAGIKESWSNMKLSNELQQRQRLDQINFDKAGTSTMVKTYKYDPTKSGPTAALRKK